MCPVVNAFYDPGQDVTVTASAGATGGRALGVPSGRNPGGPAGISDTGDGTLICPLPTANGPIFGVAQFDAAAGKLVDVMRPPKIVPLECNAAVAQGVDVSINADGTCKARAAGQLAVGRNIGPATTGTGQYVQCELIQAPASYA
jgi:predicted RecA/RadA family phage recombinase